MDNRITVLVCSKHQKSVQLNQTYIRCSMRCQLSPLRQIVPRYFFRMPNKWQSNTMAFQVRCHKIRNRTEVRGTQSVSCTTTKSVKTANRKNKKKTIAVTPLNQPVKGFNLLSFAPSQCDLVYVCNTNSHR